MRRRFGVQIATEPQSHRGYREKLIIGSSVISVAPNVSAFQDSESGVE